MRSEPAVLPWDKPRLRGASFRFQLVPKWARTTLERTVFGERVAIQIGCPRTELPPAPHEFRITRPSRTGSRHRISCSDAAAPAVGFQVFSKDGEEEFGAVRDILTDGHLVVDVENKADVLIPLDAIADVVEHKVLLDVQKLDAPIRAAIAHAHDAEVY